MAEENTQDTGTKDNPQEHNFDKGLQRLQQRQALTDRQVTEALKGINEIKESLASKGETKKADAVADALKDVDEDSSVTFGELKSILQDVGKGMSETVKTELSSVLDEVRGTAQEAKVDKYWADWSKTHASIADQKDDLLDKAEEVVNDRYGTLGDSERLVAIQVAFDQLVEQAEATSNKGGKDSGKDSTKSADGVQIEPDGSKGGVPQTTKAEDRPMESLRLWVPDSEVERPAV